MFQPQRTTAAAAATALLAALLAWSARAEEFLVLPDGTGDLPTIAAALAAARTGDSILLGDGAFHGPGNRDLSYLGKEVVIRSVSGNPHACRIDLGAGDCRAFLFESGEGPGARLEGVMLTGGRVAQEGGAMRITGGSAPTIRACLFHANRARHGGAIFIDDESWPTIEACRFLLNSAEEFGGAVRVVGHSQPTLRDCVFWRNWGYWGGALGCDYAIVFDEGNTYVENGSAGLGVIGAYGASVILTGTIVAFSDSPAIEYESGTVWLSCCDLYGNSGGDWSGWLGQQLGVEGNICADPLFCDLPGGNVDLQPGSPCALQPASSVIDACGWIGAGRLGCGRDERPAPAAVASDDLAGESPAGAADDVRWTVPTLLRPGDALVFESHGAGEPVARLSVHDLLGRRVRAIELAITPRTVLTWDGADGEGRPLARGVYLLRLIAGEHGSSRRCLLVP